MDRAHTFVTANTLTLFETSKTKPSISVIGLGYVGAVSVACLSSHGHRVVGVDIDQKRVRQVGQGNAPIHEADLSELLYEGVAGDLVTTTSNIKQAILETDVTFVSVGTPTSEDGGCNLRYIENAAREIGKGLEEKEGYHVVVLRCSVPPSTTLGVMVPEIERVSGKSMGVDFGICFNPEFLREGTAVEDFNEPSKTVIGANDKRAADMLARIYEPVDDNPIFTSIEAAEMVKYVDNVWHATKVCFANEVGRLCKPLQIDSHKVMDIFVKDVKLNLSPYYLKPGFAYGGSCLPKEVRAVSYMANQMGVDVPLISSLQTSNEQQVDLAAELIAGFGDKKIGVYGLSFKPGTDDIRESPSVTVLQKLLDRGLKVRAYDPNVRCATRLGAQLQSQRNSGNDVSDTVEKFPEILTSSAMNLVDNCEVLVVAQDSLEIRQLIASRLGRVQVVDLIRLLPTAPDVPSYTGLSW